jgi:hypothetical protein
VLLLFFCLLLLLLLLLQWPAQDGGYAVPPGPGYIQVRWPLTACATQAGARYPQQQKQQQS